MFFAIMNISQEDMLLRFGLIRQDASSINRRIVNWSILLSIVAHDVTVVIFSFEEAESYGAARIMLCCIKYAGSWVNVYHGDTRGSRLNLGVTSVDLLQRVAL